ncbi:NBS-LRR type resistance protein [Cucumis melo var. makuwa]|uniref:NBS-LRR type resistance protein n=1 Tax=Cucumis melo var. makuwa TaxID=1194695 RepID=A0A5A7U076_CUCMM|nr:NBS-LRR type resistance protein [Cucumis melo var. makuwa]
MTFTHPSCLSPVCPSRYPYLKKLKSKRNAYINQPSDPEGYTYQSSDVVRFTYQSSDPIGYAYQSSDLEGYTYQFGGLEGYTYQSRNPKGHRACKRKPASARVIRLDAVDGSTKKKNEAWATAVTRRWWTQPDETIGLRRMARDDDAKVGLQLAATAGGGCQRRASLAVGTRRPLLAEGVGCKRMGEKRGDWE